MYTRELLSFSVLVIHFYMFHACEKYKFVKEQDVELKDHVITTMTTPYVEVCYGKCVWIMNCFSINARVNRFGMIECDLNNSSKKASPEKLVATQGSQYHQFGEVSDCLTSDCRRKEALGDGWYRLGNSALKIFLENKTWSDARAHCQSLGGDLVSIETDYANRFTHDVLAKEFSFKKRELYLEDNLEANMAHFWLLNGTKSSVTLLGDPGAARYETIDGEKAIYLSGYNSYARLPAVAFNPAGFTFMIWVKPDNQSAKVDVIYSDWIPSRTFMLEVVRGINGLRYRMMRNVSGAVFLRSNPSSFQLNQWFHVAVNWNISQRSLRMFLNGIEMAEESVDKYTTIRKASNDYFLLGLGNDQVQSIGSTFHGHLKHLMIFNRSLSVEEIQTAMYWSDEGPWIGLHAQENDNAFIWPGGKEVKFRAMPSYSPQPLLSRRKCVAIGDKGKWIDNHCHEKKTFICEKNIV